MTPDCDVGVDGMSIDGVSWAKVTSIIYYGRNYSSAEADELPEFDFGLPKFCYNVEFHGIDRKHEDVGMASTTLSVFAMMRRDRVIWRTFFGCPLEGINVGSYVN